MPAKSPDQLRAAYAAQNRGESWGAEMVSATPDELKKRWMSNTEPKSTRKLRKVKQTAHNKKSKSASKRRSKK